METCFLVGSAGSRIGECFPTLDAAPRNGPEATIGFGSSFDQRHTARRVDDHCAGSKDHCLVHSSSIYQRRSEEHTSELQSRFDLVCRLLLEKKKNNKQCNHQYTMHSAQ